MRLFQKSALVVWTMVIASIALWAGEKRNISESEVQRVHRSALLIDTHNDITTMTVDGFDIGTTGSKNQTDVSRLKAGGVGATFFAAYVGPEYAAKKASANRVLQMNDTIRHDIGWHAIPTISFWRSRRRISKRLEGAVEWPP